MGTSSGMRVPVDQMTETTSQRQPRRREAGEKEGGGETATRGDTNRIRRGAARASRPRTAKPEVIEAPPRRCGGGARKVGFPSYLPTRSGTIRTPLSYQLPTGTSAIRTSISLRNPSPLTSTPALIRTSASCLRSSEENTPSRSRAPINGALHLLRCECWNATAIRSSAVRSRFVGYGSRARARPPQQARVPGRVAGVHSPRPLAQGRHPLVICHRAPPNRHMGPAVLDQPFNDAG